MNEYLSEVLNELQEIPEADRLDLIQYYEEYFLDSGKTVDEILEEYGTPKQFALKLKINYFSDADDLGQEEVQQSSPKRQMRLIWLIVLGLFASPILIPLALLFVAVLVGLIIALFAVIFSIYVVCIVILGVGVVMTLAGLMVLGQSIVSGLFFVGLGLFATGAAIFFTPILVRLTKWLAQLIMRFVKWVGRRFVTSRGLHPTHDGNER
ncbi:DUF1700 domain-containing protein [Enterococcus thailandicus]|uniref:DUF1700 domain-containing protein n=1 Tax=Enterococcus thailandicus TaxID=417368 RepID=UPI0022EBEAE2|nr:DUF1700 domain-containing protein [Enterococcus thailandicus]MDA3974755.1 DUF1700 domain-containing protein [Enterococcus thailandicus]MDA3977241.1 DUF1700 domain-containing protein [Enterococcus thailandicus]MDA3982207.1 DUF1700 domain-containing protein [Enterococcus thailandicus]